MQTIFAWLVDARLLHHFTTKLRLSSVWPNAFIELPNKFFSIKVDQIGKYNTCLQINCKALYGNKPYIHVVSRLGVVSPLL